MSDRASSIRILDDAKRLNMMDGHFVWLWIDTAAVINVKNATDDMADNEVSKRSENDDVRFKRNVDTYMAFDELEIRKTASSDIEEMNLNYLLQNDQYLLFNRNNYGVESSKSKVRRSDNKNPEKKEDSANNKINGHLVGDLPAGLLSLKPLPVKLDRHLVKGAVRLLVSVLKDVLDRSPSWMIGNLVTIQNNGCWKNNVIKESTFISDFGK